MTTIKTRVPDKLDDERDMRSFLDQLDRKHIKVGQMTDLASSPTTAELATAFNAMLAIFRTR